MMQTRNAIRKRVSVADIPVVAIATYSVALLAWLAIITRLLPVPGGSMDPGLQLSDPGVPEAMALSNGLTGAVLYVLMWGTMMIAMMYPSTVPLFRLYYRSIEGTTRPGKVARIGAFMGTYAFVWMLTGVVPLAVNAAVPLATLAPEDTGFLVGGALLLLAGYQTSSYKHRCLQQCRSPLGFLMSYHRPGVRGAVRTSWAFSVFCVGCCWALFVFMVVVGSMNIVWMALITVVLSLERVVPWGDRLAHGTGVLAGAVGVGLLVLTLV